MMTELIAMPFVAGDATLTKSKPMLLVVKSAEGVSTGLPFGLQFVLWPDPYRIEPIIKVALSMKGGKNCRQAAFTYKCTTSKFWNK